MAKKLQIGQRQASRICQMSATDRLAFIAEGLPIIHASAKGFWSASLELNAMPREAEVLEGFAKEEAAKILILLDVVRCPEKRVAGKLSMLIGRFYGHLERLIYAQLAERGHRALAESGRALANHPRSRGEYGRAHCAEFDALSAGEQALCGR
ncbi:hypothetical protein ACVWXQ_000070 [Bradyrhizobium sp. S3.14.4]